MAYNVFTPPGSKYAITPLTVPDNAIDTAFYDSGNTLGVQLLGRNVIDYGMAIAQNTIQMVSNFAGTVLPNDTIALQGQLWFNATTSTTGNLFVRTTANTSGGTANWQQLISLDVSGNLTIPGVMTAASFVGTASTATGLAGGSAGKVPYQTAPGVTAFTAVGSAGQFLTSNGTGAPTWTAGGGGGGGVTSFNTRTGVVSLTSGDVTTALTFTPYNASNPSGYISTAVTSATGSTGLSVSASTGSVTFTNTGVTSVIAGAGISVSGATGAVTVTNTGPLFSTIPHSSAQFTTSTTWVCPANVFSITVITVGAGGGGGGGANGSGPESTLQFRGGEGGFGGAAVKVVAVTPTTTYTVTIGAGGAGSLTTGATGGTTAFLLTGTPLCEASGGIGGTASAGAGPGVGGAFGTDLVSDYGYLGLGFMKTGVVKGKGGIGGFGSSGSGANGFNGMIMLSW